MESKKYRPLCFVGVGEVRRVKHIFKKLSRSKEIDNDVVTEKPKKHWKFDVDLLIKQLLDSAIAGGLTFLVTLKDGGNIEYALIMFGITFLIKLKEYRKIE